MPSFSSPEGNALVFDLDGTLVDSAPDLACAVNTIIQEQGGNSLPVEKILPLVGDGVKALLARSLATAGLHASKEDIDVLHARFQDVYFDCLVVDTKPYEGVAETLPILCDRGWKMALCTNKPQRHTMALLKQLGLESFFGAVVGGDAVPVRKPDPGHVRAALAGLGCTSDGSAMIGDSDNDTRAGRGAGCRTVLLTYGYAPDPDHALADRVLHRFADLPDALDALGLRP